MRLAVISDVHVLGPGEHEETERSVGALGHGLPPVRRRLKRGMNRMRDRFWHWEPPARRACFHQALEKIAAYEPDLVIANGDYGGDHLGVGLSDEHTFESVSFVLSEMHRTFPGRCLAVFGDHEIGKFSSVHRYGGIRLASLRRGGELDIRRFWHRAHKGFQLIGVTSSLLTLDLFLPEALPDEVPEWIGLRDAHMAEIEEAFCRLSPGDRVILFCHDPNALTVLATLPEVRKRMPQIARTIVGHVHAPSVLALQKMLRHLPALKSGHPVARIASHGAQGSRVWRQLRPKVCPSTYGVGHHVSGGVLFVEGNGNGRLTTFRRRIVC